jgi:hypothetical protein
VYRVKPSKPVAVFGAVFGLAILIVGAIGVHKNIPFLVLWICAGVFISGFNLWAAFSKNGSTESIVSADGSTPRIRGRAVTRASTGAQR